MLGCVAEQLAGMPNREQRLATVDRSTQGDARGQACPSAVISAPWPRIPTQPRPLTTYDSNAQTLTIPEPGVSGVHVWTIAF